MPNLSSALISKAAGGAFSESNLELGRVWFYSEWNSQGYKIPGGFCWQAPGTGTAIVEAWGPGGSSSLMCCCGQGLPGNSGSYSRKTLSVVSGNYICGTVGIACGNSSTLCDRGCSEPTQLCWVTSSPGCICAQGGRGGVSVCFTSGAAPYCCFLALGFCGTVGANASCGIICNFGTAVSSACAQAFGGDVNCFGGFNCVSWYATTPHSACCFYQHIEVPPGFISQSGSVITIGTEDTTCSQMFSGQGVYQLVHGIQAAGKSPVMGQPLAYCYSNLRTCGCYEMHGCISWIPVGVGAPMANPCSAIRDHGARGGPGAVRIRFI